VTEKMQFDEAEKIYRSIFRAEIPEVIRRRYQESTDLLHQSCSQEEIAECEALLKSVRDVEAVEYAARFVGKFPLLSKKVKLLVWLASTLPEQFDVFVNRTNRPIYGKFVLILAGCASALKLIKGIMVVMMWRRKHA